MHGAIELQNAIALGSNSSDNDGTLPRFIDKRRFGRVLLVVFLDSFCFSSTGSGFFRKIGSSEGGVFK